MGSLLRRQKRRPEKLNLNHLLLFSASPKPPNSSSSNSFMMQGGDTTAGDGTGGASIYGPTFDDEAFILKHGRAGVLSSANAGPHTNSSQFFVLFDQAPWLDGKHVVFGTVVEGMEAVVRAAERVGSKGGTPRAKVVVVGCGVVENSSRSTAAALPAAASKRKEDEGATLDGDDASRERLRRLRGGEEEKGSGSGVVSAPVPVRTAQDEIREAEEKAAAAAAAATEEGEEEPAHPRERVEGAAGGEAAVPSSDNDGGAAAAPPPPPPPPANSRAAKLELLRSKLAASRKANAGAVIAEKRREAAEAARGRREEEEAGNDNGNGGGGIPGFKAWSKEAAAERAAECARLGLPLTKSHLLDRADATEARLNKKKKTTYYRPATEESAQESVQAAAAYERRMAQLPADALPPPSSSSLPSAPTSSLAYGGQSRDSKEAVDRMAAELAAEGARARLQKIQRAAAVKGDGGGGGASGGDVDAISTRNEDFNRKLGVKYGKAAAEIKANLERGTALPDNN